MKYITPFHVQKQYFSNMTMPSACRPTLRRITLGATVTCIITPLSGYHLCIYLQGLNFLL